MKDYEKFRLPEKITLKFFMDLFEDLPAPCA